MAQYSVDFKNDTDRVWTMSVYQTLPAGNALDSVSWLQTTAPPSGYGSPPVSWDINYNVALGTASARDGANCYQLNQLLPCDVGTCWEIVFEENVCQLVMSEAGEPGHIVIKNRSGQLASPGIGLDGHPSVYKKDVLSGVNTLFVATPVYWVGLFSYVEPGDCIADNVVAGPLRLDFSTTATNALLTASIAGQTLNLDLSYPSSTQPRIR